MRALATVALPHADLAGGSDDTPLPHAPRSTVEAKRAISAKSRNADVGMSVSVEMTDGRDRASTNAALGRKGCREDNFSLLHASVVSETRETSAWTSFQQH